MFFYEGQTCPVCGRHFAEHDDIVTCPQCGCPHHRECWKQEGQCHFAADHGTDRQWAQQTSGPVKQQPPSPHARCPHCGGENPEFAEFCAHCGKEIAHSDWNSASHVDQTPPPPPVGQYTPPFGGYAPPFPTPLHDPYGGVPRTEEIDGVPVDQVAELVGSNSAYYLPRFHKMTHGGSKVSWNWAAFLIPSNWLLYRKNILWGVIVFVMETALQLFSQFASNALIIVDEASQTVLIPSAADMAANPHFKLLALIVMIASFASLALSILMGMFGNYLYMQSILKKARRQQENPELRYSRSFLTTGGTSFALAIAPELLVIVIEYVQVLLTMFV